MVAKMIRTGLDKTEQTASSRNVNNIVRSPDGIALHYEVDGVGSPALVFVHGWSCNRTYWADQIRAFAPRHQVVAMDLAGHGESGDGRELWTMSSFGDDVVAMVDRLGLHDVVLVGHSMGGDIVVEAALKLDGRVRGVVWVDTYRSLDHPRSDADVAAFVEPFEADFVSSTRALVRGMFPPGADPGLVDRVTSGMSSAPATIALDVLRHAISYDATMLERLPAMSVPIVAINSDYHPTDEASLRRHGVRPVLVPGVGHFLMMEDPDQFNRVLADVIRDLG
jgi:pimeloyl-ACP methyl ester carboxylesterase